MGLNEKSREFVEAIKGTREYMELIQAKANIEKNASLKSEVVEFNKRQMEIFSGKLSVKEAENRMSELNNKFGNLSKMPEVDSFVKTSKKFSDMMTRVYKSMNDSIEAELKLK